MRRDRFSKENVVAEILGNSEAQGKNTKDRLKQKTGVLGLWSELAGVGLSLT